MDSSHVPEAGAALRSAPRPVLHLERNVRGRDRALEAIKVLIEFVKHQVGGCRSFHLPRIAVRRALVLHRHIEGPAPRFCCQELALPGLREQDGRRRPRAMSPRPKPSRTTAEGSGTSVASVALTAKAGVGPFGYSVHGPRPVRVVMPRMFWLLKYQAITEVGLSVANTTQYFVPADSMGWRADVAVWTCGEEPRFVRTNDSIGRYGAPASWFMDTLS